MKKNMRISGRLVSAAAGAALLLALMAPAPAAACTVAVISGKATKDGRPLLWKNTDGKDMNTAVTYQDQKGYQFVTMGRAKSASAWVGVNEHGFGIMNSMSYNVNPKDDRSQNGVIMKLALQNCKTIEDFKVLLDTIRKPISVSANYGVIDAQGGAAFFETYRTGYYFRDVNDPQTAPDGYLVYANFSVNGEKDKGVGYIRQETAQQIFDKARAEKPYSPQWIFNSLSRSWCHSLMKVDFTDPQAQALFKGFIIEGDFISRLGTSCALIVQGIRPGEKPELATLWCNLGWPPCSVSIPAWVKLRYDNSRLIQPDAKTNNAWICDQSLVLKAEVFSVHRGRGQHYLDLSKVYNPAGTGYQQKLAPIEARVFELTDAKLEAWRKKGAIDLAEAKALVKEIDNYVQTNWPKK